MSYGGLYRHPPRPWRTKPGIPVQGVPSASGSAVVGSGSGIASAAIKIGIAAAIAVGSGSGISCSSHKVASGSASVGSGSGVAQTSFKDQSGSAAVGSGSGISLSSLRTASGSAAVGSGSGVGAASLKVGLGNPEVGSGTGISLNSFRSASGSAVVGSGSGVEQASIKVGLGSAQVGSGAGIAVSSVVSAEGSAAVGSGSGIAVSSRKELSGSAVVGSGSGIAAASIKAPSHSAIVGSGAGIASAGIKVGLGSAAVGSGSGIANSGSGGEVKFGVAHVGSGSGIAGASIKVGLGSKAVGSGSGVAAASVKVGLGSPEVGSGSGVAAASVKVGLGSNVVGSGSGISMSSSGGEVASGSAVVGSGSGVALASDKTGLATIVVGSGSGIATAGQKDADGSAAVGSGTGITVASATGGGDSRSGSFIVGSGSGISASSAAGTRVTDLVHQTALSDPGAAETRATDLVHQIVQANTPSETRVTDLVVQYAYPPGAPELPYIDVSACDENSITVILRVPPGYVDPNGDPHDKTIWQMAADNDPTFSSPTTHDPGSGIDLTTYVWTGLSQQTYFWFRMQVWDDTGAFSGWSIPIRATTKFTAEDPADFSPLWNTEPGQHLGTPGAWAIPGAGAEPFYAGRWNQVFRYHPGGVPAALARDQVFSAGLEQNVTGQTIFASPEGGIIGGAWGYYGAELARAGIGALMHGWGDTPNWNPSSWGQNGQFVQRSVDPLSGVYAMLHMGFIWPFGPCEPLGPTGPFSQGVSRWEGNLDVAVWENGVEVATWLRTPLPYLRAVARACSIYPWYSLELDVTKNPLDKRELTIKVAVLEGQVNSAFATQGFWNFDEMYTTAAELPCGQGAYVGYRLTTFDNGWNAFQSLQVDNKGTDVECEPLPECPPENPDCFECPEDDPDCIPPGLPGGGDFNCPPEPPGEHLELFLGRQGGNELYQYGADSLDDDVLVTALVRPNTIAPVGYSGEFLYRNIYLVFGHSGDFSVDVHAEVDGRRTSSKSVLEVGSGTRVTKTIEIPLTEAHARSTVDRLRHGQRGTYFTCDIVLTDICGSGVELYGIDLDVEEVRESQPHLAYESWDEQSPPFVPDYELFLGQRGGNKLYKSATTGLDDDQEYVVRARPNVVAPAGPGGEATFENLYLLLKRWNTSAMALEIVPIVNGVELTPVPLSYAATTEPVLEPVEIPITVPHDRSAVTRIRTKPRGQWFTFELRSVSGATVEEIMVAGAVLEGEKVQESMDHVT